MSLGESKRPGNMMIGHVSETLRRFVSHQARHHGSPKNNSFLLKPDPSICLRGALPMVFHTMLNHTIG